MENVNANVNDKMLLRLWGFFFYNLYIKAWMQKQILDKPIVKMVRLLWNAYLNKKKKRKESPELQAFDKEDHCLQILQWSVKPTEQMINF